MVRITKVTTRTGDGGETGLASGRRVSKADARVEAYGDIDELMACLGLCRLAIAGVETLSKLDALLETILHRLFDLGAEIASEPPEDAEPHDAALTSADLRSLEAAIEAMNGTLPPLTSFVLPGGSEAAARLHLARTVCRRAERRVVALGPKAVRPLLVAYLNRLSDLLFVAARKVNQTLGEPEVLWAPRRDTR
jgi:cob(I)alamin adenosyltransferase